MTKGLLDLVGLLSNFAAILTAIIASIFYYRTQAKNYYLNEIAGNYKIFDTLKNQPKTTALYHLNIKYVSSRGHFFGNLEYSEPFKSAGSGSGGSASIYGKISYSFFRVFIGYALRKIMFKSFNPLETNNVDSFRGKLYLLSRNDLDISKRNWKDMLVQEYSIMHYKDAQRIKLYDTISYNSYLLIPDEITLVNVDKIPDLMFGG